MKRKFKAILSLLMAVAMTFSLGTVALAAESNEMDTQRAEMTVQPKAILAYVDHYHNGKEFNSIDWFNVQIPSFNWTANQITIKTSGFDSGTRIVVSIGNLLNSYTIYGNGEVKNIKLDGKMKDNTNYCAEFLVMNASGNATDNGRIELWLY